MSAALVSGWSRNWRGKPLCGSLSRRSGRSVPSDWAYWCHDAGVGRNRREGVGRACSANALRSPPRAAEARPGIDRRQSGARARWPNPEHLSDSSARRPRWSPRKGARSRLSCHRFRPRDRVSTFNNVSASVPRHPAPRPDPFGKRRSRRRRKIGPDYVRTSCSRLHTGTGTGFGPLTWRRAAHSDRFGARCTLPTAQSTRSIEQDELGT